MMTQAERVGWSVILAFALGCVGETTTAPTVPTPRGEPAPAPHAAVIESTSDVGDVDFSKPYSHTFDIANTGGSPLRLTLARKSCHCADVQVPAAPVAPGQKGEVTLRWVPMPGQHGSYTLAADLDTNDPQRPRLRLELKGRVNPVVRVWPEDWMEIDFKQILPGQPQQREVKVFSTTLPGFGLTATTSHPGLKVALEKLIEGSQAGDQSVRSGYLVTVRTGPELPRGYFRETLRLDISGDQPRQLTLPVYGEMETGVLRLAPREIEFKKPRVTEADSQRVQVQFLVPSEGERVEVTAVEPAFLVAEPPRQLKRGLWQFIVRIPADHAEAAKLQAGGFFEGRVVLKTSSASAPEVPVRVKWVRPDS